MTRDTRGTTLRRQGRLVAILFAAAALTLAGCSSSGDNDGSGSGGASPMNAGAKIAVPDVTGKTGDKAKSEIVAAGLTATLESTNGKGVFLASNWTVKSTDPKAGTMVEAGSKVTVTVFKPEDSSTSSPSQAAKAKTTKSGLTDIDADVACDQAADKEFPYGYRRHVTGGFPDRIEGDTWFTKYTATVKNAFDAKRDYTIECTVGGTPDDTTIVSFNAY